MESRTTPANGSSYSSRTGLSKSWKVVKTHAGIYTGGKVQVFHRDERSLIACMLHEDVAIVDGTTGELQRTVQQDKEEEEKEAFLVFAIRPKYNQIVTAGRNLLIRLWDLDTFTCIRTIKAHESPVLAMDFDPSGTLLATGGSDRSVKVFDIEKGYCTHNFRRHSGIVTLVKFHPDVQKLQLVSCSDDTTVRVWDLHTQKEVACIGDHMSAATCVAFSTDGETLLTASRDKVINFWDLTQQTLAKTLVTHEAIEGLQVLSPSFKHLPDSISVSEKQIWFVTAGEKGILRLWNNSKEMWSQKPQETSVQYVDLQLNDAKRELIAVSSEQNFLVFNEHLVRTRQIIGYNDDVLALKYIPSVDEMAAFGEVAVATNSEQIRLLNRQTLSCELLSGHTDIVMALDTSPDGKWLVSASKDRTARVWDVANRKCIATCIGHTEALGAIGISQKLANYATGQAFFVTGSTDKTLKMWSLRALKSVYGQTQTTHSVGSVSIASVGAVKAHDKDVNAIVVAPNDRFVASASQDKLVKVWTVPQLGLAGVCRGHKRGVWAIEFSPVDQCLASASGDKTVKVWSMKDFTCLKTFEGHTASVLNVRFVCAGMQLMSVGADGLVKLWTIKSNECEATFDEHMDKIWALDVAKDSSEMVTGGADSTIHIWGDITVEEEKKAQEAKEAKVLKEQQLMNCLRQHKFSDAVELAFELQHPHRLFLILRELLEGSKDKDPLGIRPETCYASVLEKLSDEQLGQLLEWIKEWNTNTRHSSVCQVLISTLLRHVDQERLKRISNIGKTLEALIAYSDRHFQRVDRMLQKSYLVDYSIYAMNRVVPEVDLQEGNRAKRARVDI